METFDFDAFGNPLRPRSVTNGKPRAIVLHGDDVYDPALAPCYVPTGSRRSAADLFLFSGHLRGASKGSI